MSEKVSVLVTVYNGESYIEKCITSVLNQAYINFELIIVNDGSQDRTAEIVNKYESIDNRIVNVFRSENKGRVFSLNEGIENCTTNFIFINDIDDFSSKERLSQSMNFYNQLNPLEQEEFGLLGTASYEYDEKNDHCKKYSIKFGSMNRKKIPEWRLYFGIPFVHSSVMYSKKALNSIGSFTEEVSSCIDLFTIIKIANKYKIYGINEFLCVRSVNNDSFFTSKNIDKKGLYNMEIIRNWQGNNIKYHKFIMTLHYLIKHSKY
ncbi:glycosyltransferase family 2 protein [Carnobacterium inhibens]|uniref:Glycosyltransferase n=1 Tax=Carnobacterium inhibens TaxID=147709 RepID=A0ABR7TD55_9LACT|nr:glycosyltransferase family 2 protein [Carnobacterium inhibens]MBC9825918.1 glycosyltransferase [Carnobacterium inhibens]